MLHAERVAGPWVGPWVCRRRRRRPIRLGCARGWFPSLWGRLVPAPGVGLVGPGGGVDAALHDRVQDRQDVVGGGQVRELLNGLGEAGTAAVEPGRATTSGSRLSDSARPSRRPGTTTVRRGCQIFFMPDRTDTHAQEWSSRLGLSSPWRSWLGWQQPAAVQRNSRVRARGPNEMPTIEAAGLKRQAHMNFGTNSARFQ